MMSDDRIYVDKFSLSGFDVERNIVYFNVRNISDEKISDIDEQHFLEIAKHIGKWERYIRYERAKINDINQDKTIQVITEHEFYDFTFDRVHEAFMRSGRRYTVMLEPKVYTIESKYQISNDKIIDFIRTSFINLNKWLYLKENKQ